MLPLAITNVNPIPKFDQSGIVSYGYEDSVFLISTVTLPDSLDSDTLFVKADVEWLVCKESCIPGSTSVTLPLDIGAAAPSSSCTFVRESQSTTPLASLRHRNLLSRVSHLSTLSFLTHLYTRHQKLHQHLTNHWYSIRTRTYHSLLLSTVTGGGSMNKDSAKTDDGGLLIQLDCESFEAEKLPTADRIGGLIQLQVDGKWIQTETVSTLQMIAKDTTVNKIDSPLFAKGGTIENQSADEGGAVENQVVIEPIT